MKKITGLAAVALLAVAMPAYAKDDKKEPKLTEELLRPLQQREFAVSKDALFMAAVSMLQSEGYRDINANKDAGTISAQTDAKSKLIYNIFWGFGKKKLTQVASLFIEPRGEAAARLRIGLSTVETKSRIYGMSSSDGTPIMFASPYADFFSTLEQEVATRQAEASGSVMPAAAPATEAAPAPAAAPVVAPAPSTN